MIDREVAQIFIGIEGADGIRDDDDFFIRGDQLFELGLDDGSHFPRVSIFIIKTLEVVPFRKEAVFINLFGGAMEPMEIDDDFVVFRLIPFFTKQIVDPVDVFLIK